MLKLSCVSQLNDTRFFLIFFKGFTKKKTVLSSTIFEQATMHCLAAGTTSAPCDCRYPLELPAPHPSLPLTYPSFALHGSHRPASDRHVILGVMFSRVCTGVRRNYNIISSSVFPACLLRLSCVQHTEASFGGMGRGRVGAFIPS